ncbi:unnamed protein product [Brassica oleracea var. botrytis]
MRTTSNGLSIPDNSHVNVKRISIDTAPVRDAGNLLTRAGFSLPGVDVDDYVVSALDLIDHLRAMGETNALLHRTRHVFLSFFLLS